MTKKYKCFRCHGVFANPEDWTDDDAEAELWRKIGEIDEDDLEIICDDCYWDFMKWFKSQGQPQ